jgi:RHS repeat-associated protein
MSLCAALGASMICLGAADALAQTGVDDDRVSLPDGPGSLEGVGDNVELDPNMGTMSWGAPIDIPKGHVTPDVGVAYNSGGGNGPLGVGWSMPTSTVERMTSRGVPGYDADDFIAANGGAELVRVGEDGDGNPMYRERFEKSFKRYVWVGAGAQGYWKVECPDGSVEYYGADASGEFDASARAGSALGTFKYHLVEKVDAWGHVAHYSYDAFDSNQPLLTRIDYLIVDDAPRYSVVFGYQARPDLLSDANPGYEDLLTRRLSSLSVLAGGETISEYVLDYEDAAASGGLSRLTRIRRYGVGGQASGELYPIEYTFEYSMTLGGCTESATDCDSPFVVSVPAISGAENLGSGCATLIDIDGDALPDILDTTDPGAHVFYRARLTPQADGSFTHSFEAAQASAHGQGGTFGLGVGGTQILDVDGDGRSDLLNPTSGAWLRNDPGAPDWTASANLSGLSALQNLDFSEARFLDYDNDRRIDFITSDGASTTVYANTDEGFEVRALDSAGVAFDSERGLLSSITRPNGARTTFAYDALRRLESKLHHGPDDAILHGLVFERDRVGNVLSANDTAADSDDSRAYTYDAWYRMVSAELGATDAPDASLALTYDDLDRVVGRSSAGASTQMTWDHRGRLTGVTAGGDTTRTLYGAGPGRVARRRGDALTLYGFDDFEVRDGVGVVHVRHGGEHLARHQTPDFGASVLEDADGDASLTAHDAHLVAARGDDPALWLGAAAARVLAEQEDAVLHLHTDHQRSIVATTDAAGALRGRRTFYPFGRVRASQGYLGDYGFTGQEHDAAADLVYFQFRALDPDAGRWTSYDPLFETLEPSMMASMGEATTGYAYVANNPSNVIDPTGLLGLAEQAAGGRVAYWARQIKARNDLIKATNTFFSDNPKITQKQRFDAVKQYLPIKNDRQMKKGAQLNQHYAFFLDTQRRKAKEDLKTLKPKLAEAKARYKNVVALGRAQKAEEAKKAERNQTVANIKQSIKKPTVTAYTPNNKKGGKPQAK